tara:strand:+ start:6106 stop:7263 length:1158 start_codon:yes stop_codon:yes gene_type:complete
VKVALVHDWLTGMRGGEAVLEAISEIFPQAELFTLIHIPGTVSPQLASLKKHTSFLQKFPQIEKRYRQYLPFMPKAIESLDLSEFDLILSSSHCVAKGVQKSSSAVHVSYVHAPMRYMWDRFDDYFGPGKASFLVRLAARLFRKPLQNWDKKVSSIQRVDHLIGNSQFIANQIESAYGRKASVVYPFAKLERFKKTDAKRNGYLMVGAFAPYKRVDLAIEVFNELGLPLRIVGKGQEFNRLKKQAGPTIELLGSLSDAAIEDLYSKSKAFIFPGKEDFGITPLEAMASGLPVIAFGEGGASETVSSQAGILFLPQTVEALKKAVLEVENNERVFDPDDCRARAKEFSLIRFQENYLKEVLSVWKEKKGSTDSLKEVVDPQFYLFF